LNYAFYIDHMGSTDSCTHGMIQIHMRFSILNHSIQIGSRVIINRKIYPLHMDLLAIDSSYYLMFLRLFIIKRRYHVSRFSLLWKVCFQIDWQDKLSLGR